MDTKTASKKFNLTRDYINRMCRTGKLKAEMKGGAWHLKGTPEQIAEAFENRKRVGWVLKEKVETPES